jgi:hypothetical protein
MSELYSYCRILVPCCFESSAEQKLIEQLANLLFLGEEELHLLEVSGSSEAVSLTSCQNLADIAKQ